MRSKFDLCKKDFDLNCMLILSPFFLTITESSFLTGELEVQEDALKVEKSCLPSKIFAPFLSKFKSSFLLICQALHLSIDKGPGLLMIKYS